MTEAEKLAVDCYEQGIAEGMGAAEIILLLAEKLGMIHPASQTKL
ncbi:MAG: hypothetical protein ACREDO_00205 [Methyloceanibacter sp.]